MRLNNEKKNEGRKRKEGKLTWILFYLRESGIDIGNRNREEELRRKAKEERFGAQLEAQRREEERRKEEERR